MYKYDENNNLNFLYSDIYKDENHLNYDFNIELLHPDIRRDLEMSDMCYEKYIGSTEYSINKKYIDQFFESKYENYITISKFINVFFNEELSLYNVCNFYKIYFNYSTKIYYFRISPENENIFSSDNWPDMKVFLMSFIDEYIDKINKDKVEKERLMFEDIRKYILLKGISRKDFADMIKL